MVTKEDVIPILEELGLLNTRLTVEELSERCKIPVSSFYKRNLHKHPKIDGLRYRVGKTYIYKLEAVNELNDLLERDVSWDVAKNQEY